MAVVQGRLNLGGQFASKNTGLALMSGVCEWDPGTRHGEGQAKRNQAEKARRVIVTHAKERQRCCGPQHEQGPTFQSPNGKSSPNQ